jgi:hypothetical protein
MLPLTHAHKAEPTRHTVLLYLRQPGAPVTVSPPSDTEVRSGSGGTGGLGRRRRLGSRRPHPGAGDVRINLGLVESDPEQW